MGRLLLSAAVALRRLILHPGRTVLIQAGLAGGVAALVATLCLIEGTKQRWADYSRYTEPTHLTLDGAFAFMQKKQATVTLLGFQRQFAARVERFERDGGRLKLFPTDPTDMGLANEIEVWLLEQGVPAHTQWRVKGSRSAAIQETIRRIGVLFYTAAALCLLTGAVGLFAIQKAAADQRRVELAVRRVEGATSGDIIFMLLAEALLVACLGLLTGIPIGVGAAKVIEALLEGDAGFAFPLVPVASCATILALLSVAFGLLPAWESVRAQPSATLHEA